MFRSESNNYNNCENNKSYDINKRSFANNSPNFYIIFDTISIINDQFIRSAYLTKITNNMASIFILSCHYIEQKWLNVIVKSFMI